MKRLKAWWVAYCRSIYKTSRIRPKHYVAYCLFLLVVSALFVAVLTADTHPVIHGQVVKLSHAQWLGRVRFAALGMVAVNAFIIFQVACMRRYGPEPGQAAV